MSMQAGGGSWWDMPVHPALVHFPIAFLFTASVLIVVRHAVGRQRLEQYIAPLLVVGVATLPLVITAGIRDAGWLDLFREADPSQPLMWHALTAVLMSATSATHAVVRARSDGRISRATDLGLAVATAWLLVTTGLLAAEMVYA